MKRKRNRRATRSEGSDHTSPYHHNILSNKFDATSASSQTVVDQSEGMQQIQIARSVARIRGRGSTSLAQPALVNENIEQSFGRCKYTVVALASRALVLFRQIVK